MSAIGPQWRIAMAEKMRSAMGPEMCAVADALRETFGPDTKLNWLETSTLSHGTPPEGEPIGEKAHRASRAA